MLFECEGKCVYALFCSSLVRHCPHKFAIATDTVTPLTLFNDIAPRKDARIFTSFSNAFYLFLFININPNSTCPYIFSTSKQIFICYVLEFFPFALNKFFKGFSIIADYAFHKLARISYWSFKNISKILVKQATMFLLVKVREYVVNFKV